MPAHVRAQIRAKIVEALQGLPTTGANVFPGRTRPLGDAHAPTLLVYVTTEQSDNDAMGGVLGRILNVVVEGRVIMADVPDDTLDTIAKEVEPAMVARPLLGGLVKEVTLISTAIQTQAPGQSHAGEVVMKFRVQYRTLETAPDTAI
jgi:hypothetical protein